MLHAKTTGTCKKIKIDKLAKADMKIKMLLNNENILATGKDLDGNNPFQMIEGTVTFQKDISVNEVAVLVPRTLILKYYLYKRPRETSRKDIQRRFWIS